MLIRPAKKKDIPDLNRLLLQVLTVHHEGRPDLFKKEARKYTDRELEELLLQQDKPIFVAEDGENGVVGYLFCVFIKHENHNILTDIKTLYVDDLCIDQRFRGRGIGRALYEFAVDFAQKSGCYNLTLNVWSCNRSAMAFYEKCGLLPQKVGMELIL